jgi:hypothetical protein
MDEEDQNECRGMTVQNFRQFAEDTLLQSFFLIDHSYQHEGTQKYL